MTHFDSTVPLKTVFKTPFYVTFLAFTPTERSSLWRRFDAFIVTSRKICTSEESRTSEIGPNFTRNLSILDPLGDHFAFMIASGCFRFYAGPTNTSHYGENALETQKKQRFVGKTDFLRPCRGGRGGPATSSEILEYASASNPNKLRKSR